MGEWSKWELGRDALPERAVILGGNTVRSQNSSAGPDSEYSCGSCRFSPRVAMMKSADPRQSDDFGIRGLSSLLDSPHWRVSEAGVDSIFVVVVDVLAKESP